MASPATTYLFVPASRPERYDKALATSADDIIIDLEDAVSVADKDSSLESLLAAIEAGLDRPVYVRINAADSQWFERDVQALAALSAEAAASLKGVMLPKADSADAVERIAQAVSGKDVIALIESAAGVANVQQLAAAVGTTRLAVGALDLAADLGVSPDSPTITWVFAQFVLASRVAQLAAPIASPNPEFRDVTIVEHQAREIAALGFGAQLCIHPAQLEPVAQAFLPSAEQRAWAERVLAASDDTDGAVQLDGQMIDRPVVERAKGILARANLRASGS